MIERVDERADGSVEVELRLTIVGCPAARQIERDVRSAVESALDGAPYDLMGNVRFVLPWLSDSERGWFCSEALGAALGWKEPWRYGPNGAAAMARTMYSQPAEAGVSMQQRTGGR